MGELLLKGRTALITGASRGIGAAVAKRYASLGAHVIIIGRKSSGLEEVDDAIQKNGNGSATLVPMDLRKLDKIDQLCVSIAERFGKLDILVGNAGILGELSPVKYVSNKMFNQVFATNVMANHCLLRNFDPLLQKSDAGRAIFVTSSITDQVHPFWGTYSASKAALEMLVKTYAMENQETNICANLIDPGPVHSQLRSAAFPGEDISKLRHPEDVTSLFVELALPTHKQSGKIVSSR
jgi:NAD(P)-dependent dehydrogenase (short-subunit alcohol dehydrogenase family)